MSRSKRRVQPTARGQYRLKRDSVPRVPEVHVKRYEQILLELVKERATTRTCPHCRNHGYVGRNRFGMPVACRCIDRAEASERWNLYIVHFPKVRRLLSTSYWKLPLQLQRLLHARRNSSAAAGGEA